MLLPKAEQPLCNPQRVHWPKRLRSRVLNARDPLHRPATQDTIHPLNRHRTAPLNSPQQGSCNGGISVCVAPGHHRFDDASLQAFRVEQLPECILESN